MEKENFIICPKCEAKNTSIDYELIEKGKIDLETKEYKRNCGEVKIKHTCPACNEELEIDLIKLVK